MPSLNTFLTLLHLLGLAFALGASTVKVILLIRCLRDRDFIPTYLQVIRPITRVIISGLVLLTLSGIAWIFLTRGHPLTARLIVKLLLVVAVWIIGPIIDNVLEPKYRHSAPSAGESPSNAFLRAQRRYLEFELLATGIFYAITAFWVLT